MTETKKAIKARGFWRKAVKIGKITGHRHHVIFPDREGEETSVTWCNFCGQCFTLNDKCTGCGKVQE